MAFRFPVTVERVVSHAFLSLPPAVLRRIVGPPRYSPDGLELDLQLQALLWLIDRFRVRVSAEGPVDRVRTQTDRAAPTLDLAPARDVAAYDRTVPGALGPRRARVYVPKGAPSTGAPGPVFFHGGGDWYLGHHLRDPADAKNPLASPLFADDVSRLPPALVLTAGFDPLRDEGRAYADRMRAAGVDVELVCTEGQMHGFLLLAGAVRDDARIVELTAARLRATLSSKP